MFIQIEEELKMQIMKLKAKYEQKNVVFSKLKMEMQKFKNERMIEEEIADNAKLFFSVISVNFTRINKKYQNLFITLIYRDEVKNTSVISTNRDLIWNENFEL